MLETLFFCVWKIQFLSRFQVQFLCVLKIQFLWTKSDCLPVCLMAVGFGNIICPHEGASFCYLVFFWVQLSSCLPLSVDLGPFICIVWIPSAPVCLCGQSIPMTLLCSLSAVWGVFGLLYSTLAAEWCWFSYLLCLNAVVDVIVIGFLVLSVFLLLLWSAAAVLVSATLTCSVLLAFLLFLSSNRNTDFMESTRKWFCGCHKYSSKCCECWYF